jgi:hypothetical protein
MTAAQFFRSTLVSLASTGLLIPQAALAAPPATHPIAGDTMTLDAPPSVTVIDVALGDGGVLRGQVVDPQGMPLAGTAVYLRQQQQQVGATLTNTSGSFVLTGLHGGIYQAEAAQGQGTYRLWAPRTAPPAAKSAAMIVAGSNTLRGQGGGARSWLASPWILAGLVGAAITVPIALSNSKKEGS